MTAVPGDFWDEADRLLAAAEIVIDRPRGTRHPRYADTVYPLDYGYLAGTTASDGAEVDVWVGSAEPRALDAVVCTVDPRKQDVEVKLLLGCTADEKRTVLAFHVGAMLVERPARPAR